MLKQIREAAQLIKPELASIDTSSYYLNRSQFIDLCIAKGMPIKSIEYDGGFYARTYNGLWPNFMPSKTIIIANHNLNAEDATQKLFALSRNKMAAIVWVAFLRVIDNGRGNADYQSMMYNLGQQGSSDMNRDDMLTMIDQAAAASIDKAIYKWAIGTVESNIEKLQKRVNEFSKSSKEKVGLENVFDKRPNKPDDALIESQIEAAYHAMPNNMLVSRTWGFELEIADAKGVDAVFGIEKGQDGSLRSYESTSDCDCSCDECFYHECDCEYCETGSSDPDHCNGSSCSSADSAEFRTVKGSNRAKHAGLFKLCDALEAENAEVNDTCGIHIHVYAQDLTTRQVANVLAVYKYLDQIMMVIADRDDVNYAKRIPVDYVRQAYKGQLPIDKPRAVNLTHIANSTTFDYMRGTIEFRQMAGGYNAPRITFWSWLLRGLVTTAQRGAELKDFMKVKDIDGIIETFARFNYFLHDENPALLIPGGQQDNKHIKRLAHGRA